jgi:hypothetical protein
MTGVPQGELVKDRLSQDLTFGAPSLGNLAEFGDRDSELSGPDDLLADGRCCPGQQDRGGPQSQSKRFRFIVSSFVGTCWKMSLGGILALRSNHS